VVLLKTIKVSVKEVEESQDVCAQVSETLKNDPKNAYTIGGLMITAFGVKQSDISNKSFSEWKEGQPTLYSRIRKCLDKAVALGKVKQKKHKRAMVYWWAEKS
jgi:hypothetical protein